MKKKQPEVVETKLTDEQVISANEKIGTNASGDLIYQKKINIVNEIVKLEDEVQILQDKVYGSADYGSKGLYGKALECRKSKAAKTGELSFIPDKSPVIEEDQLRVGQDMQTKKLVTLTEENLLKRLEKFKEYKRILYSRQDQIEDYIEKCQLELKK